MNAHALGLLSMFGSALCFSVTSTLIRFAPNIDPFTSSLYRFAIGMALLGSAAMTKRIRLEFTNTSLLFSRGLFGGVAVFLFFWSINAIGLGKGTVLSYSYPLFAAVWGVILLGEKVSARLAGLILIAFCGVALTFLGRDVGFGASGLGLYEGIALLGAMLSGLAIVIVRKLRETESSYAIFFSQCVIGFWLMVIPANLVPTAIGIQSGFVLLGIGVSAAVGQLLMTSSYKVLSVSKGSAIALVTPVVNIVIGMAIFNEPISLLSGCGMFLVLAACTLISIHKQ